MSTPLCLRRRASLGGLLLVVLCLGCSCAAEPYNSVAVVDELGYGPAGRSAILRQAIDTNDQTYLYSPAGQLLPVRLALQTQPGIDAEIGALEYAPLSYLLRRALITDYPKLAQSVDPAADPILTSDSADATRIFNHQELDRGRKVVRTYGAIGSLGFLRPDSVAMEGGIPLSRRFGVDLYRTFVIYGIVITLSGERFAFYMPVPVQQFEATFDDLMEKKRAFTIIDFAGWYYKHQAFVSTQAEFTDHYWVLPVLVGPVPQYTKDSRYQLGDREEQQVKYLAERPLEPRDRRQVLHRAVFEFVNGKARGMLRHRGQLLLTAEQVFNALVADSISAAPDGQAPQLSELTVVVVVDTDEAGVPPNLGELKDALDLIARQKVARIFVKLLSEPGPADINLDRLREKFLEQRAAIQKPPVPPQP